MEKRRKSISQLRTNKKIKNAKTHTYNGIEFKSGLEVNVYKRIVQFGITPQYEGHKYIVWQGFKPSQPFFNKDKTGNLKIQTTKVLDITYTPDFSFYYKGYLIIIESKGFATNEFLMKRKMFRKLLEDMGNVIYFEVHNLKQLDQAMEIVSEL